MKQKFLLFLSGGFMLTGLIFFSCSKQEPVEPPEPATEGYVNYGRCSQAGCASPVTCSNREHEKCGVCGISRRPPRGCMCGSGSTGGGNGGGGSSDIPMDAVRSIGNQIQWIPNDLDKPSYWWYNPMLDYWNGYQWGQGLPPHIEECVYLVFESPLDRYIETPGRDVGGLPFRLKAKVPYTPFTGYYHVRHDDGRTLGTIPLEIR